MGYQVPMMEVAVTIALSGVEPDEYFLYLSPFSERREGPETVADYLNGTRRFFPMMLAGVPKMINRDQIIWVRHERIERISDLEATVVEKLTILELADGSRLEGMMPIDRPLEQSRISDVLNDGIEAFVRLDEETESYFVNKKFIRTVIPR